MRSRLLEITKGAVQRREREHDGRRRKGDEPSRRRWAAGRRQPRTGREETQVGMRVRKEFVSGSSLPACEDWQRAARGSVRRRRGGGLVRLRVGVLSGLVALVALLALMAGSAFAASAPAIEEEFVVDVSSTSATLHATIDPGESATSYRFEYGASTSYGSNAPVPDGSAGSGSSAVEVSVHIDGLVSATTYHYRLVAENEEGSESGIDLTFTTQRPGEMFALQGGRGWEMVSPPNKYGALVEPITFEGSPVQAAPDGAGMAYAMNGAPEPEVEGNRSLEDMEMLATRGPAGWSSKDITVQQESPAGVLFGGGNEYRMFSTNLSQSIVEPRDETRLSPEASEYTIYRRDSSTGTFTPLVTPANVSEGVEFGLSGTQSINFEGSTPDLSHVIFKAVAPLVEGAPRGSLYEWANGQIQLVSVLPDGTMAAAPMFGAERSGSRRNEISQNGQRVIFLTNKGYPTYDRHVYLRDLALHETVEISASQGGTASGSIVAPEFQLANAAGSEVFFTDEERLTPDSTAEEGAPDLYEYTVEEAGGKLTGTLSDISVDPNVGEAAHVVNTIAGAGEDGSDVYFVARGRLTGEPRPGCLAELSAEELAQEEASEEGRCRATRGGYNFYLSKVEAGHPGARTIMFIATLTAEDYNDWVPVNTGYVSLEQLTARVTPSGRYLAFMSDAPLTGYDNRDARSGMPDEEVYVYDTHTGAITCVSCNPTGGRPQGTREERLGLRGPMYDTQGFWGNRWLAASIPGWTTMGHVRPIYQSRYLSDAGQVFFNSADALVPQDTNGQVDVYEYEPAGVGGCTTASSSYSDRSGGCVGLMSSGTSSRESAFLDASESGNDVFFVTAASLVGKDFDTAYDVYDAHVCSSAAPCITEATSPPACTTTDSCRAAPQPQPTTFGAPSSATFSGAGNLTPEKAKERRLATREKLTRKQRLRLALHACKRHHRHGGRAQHRCERRARRRLSARGGRAMQTGRGRKSR